MPDERFERSRARRLVLLGIVSVVLLALIYVIAVHTAWGQRVDDAALEGRTNRESVIRVTQHLLDTISVASLALGSAAIVAVAIVRRRPHLAVTAGLIILGANVSTQLLKKVILDRPHLGERPFTANWFPSGHSTVAMSLAVALVVVVTEDARPIAALVGLVYATLVGAGTVTLGWHRPSDVLGAYLVVTAWTGFALAALVHFEGAVQERASRLARRIPSLGSFLAGLGIGVLVGALFGVGGTLVAARTEQLDAVRLDATYAASVAVIAGFALVMLVAVVACLRGVSLDPPASVESPQPAVAPGA
jgi:membrane-associated phospholipid phosphatase